MDRRSFLKVAGASMALGAFPLGRLHSAWASRSGQGAKLAAPGQSMPGQSISSQSMPDKAKPDKAIPDKAIKDRLVKSRNFDHLFEDDIVLSASDRLLLKSSLDRLKRVQRLVGYGHFCLIGFDDALAYARSYSRVGGFTAAELAFLEKIFYSPAKSYGFFGEKPIDQMTGQIRLKEAVKIPGTGNYLYRGKPSEIYHDIRTRIGEDAVLTSGIRGVMKQFLLFLNKAHHHAGNLSLASRSLAPPGYSFHGVGDFDVGEKGYGVDNFTEKFTRTRVYERLSDLGYIRFRYDRDNDLGVRFEPWHIEVG